jgi:hypothetical protein
MSLQAVRADTPKACIDDQEQDLTCSLGRLCLYLQRMAALASGAWWTLGWQGVTWMMQVGTGQ